MINQNENNKITNVLFAEDAISKLKKGLDTAVAAVGCTMGPKGKCVVIQRDDEIPIVTKDGVTVSKSIKLKDPVERIGANLVKEAAGRTNDIAGDGTTTSTVLTGALTNEGLKAVSAGRDRVFVRKGMQDAVNKIIEHLKKSAKPIQNKEEIVQIGTISANGDKAIGEMIAEAMEKVGSDGVVTVEEATGMNTTCDVVEGMQLERGYISPMFVTNNDKMVATYNDAYVLVTDKKISALRDIVPILENVSRANKPLLIIADDVEGDALHGLIINKLQGSLKVIAIKAPGFGILREEILVDICSLTGSKLISDKTGLSFDKVSLKDLGGTKKITIDSRSTVIVGSGATAEKVISRANELRSQLEDSRLNEDERNVLKRRLAKLAAGVAVIKVGGSTEVEMKERKYRIEDALSATQSAIEEGILSGGGMALFSARNCLNDILTSENKDYVAGVEAVYFSCTAPLATICKNSGISHEVVFERLHSEHAKLAVEDIQRIGWDAANEKIVDMFRSGIIDPVKVTRSALENACSVATTFLSLDAIIVEEKE